MWKVIRFFSLLGLVFFFKIDASYAGGVTLSWNAVTASGLSGYRLHYGTSPRSYGTTVGVGNVTSYTVTGLASGTYYFAVTTLSSSGESGFSNEVNATVSSTSTTPGSLVSSLTLVSSSQNFDSAYSIEKLWDGCLDPTSACTVAARAPSFWMIFDLGRDYNLTSASLFGDDVDLWYSSTWQLQYRRNESEPWTTAFSNLNSRFNGWSDQSLNVTGRYVRVEVFGNPSLPATEARELRILGTAVPSQPPQTLPAPTNVTVK